VTIADQVEANLDKRDGRSLGIVHRIIASLGPPADEGDGKAQSWNDFLASTYGSMADAPFERGDQGEPENRSLLR